MEKKMENEMETGIIMGYYFQDHGTPQLFRTEVITLHITGLPHVGIRVVIHKLVTQLYILTKCK